MQVTDEMARAAWDCWLEFEAEGGLDRDTVMRHAVQAALDAMPKATGGYVPGPDGDSVRLRLSDASCTYTLPPEMTRGALPPDATVSINLSAPDDKTIIETLARVLGPAKQQSMPVTEPRPLARQSALHLHLGIGEVAMARMIRFRDDYRPPTPLPIHEATADSEALYDPEEVKAWYDALPQAADG